MLVTACRREDGSETSTRLDGQALEPRLFLQLKLVLLAKGRVARRERTTSGLSSEKVTFRVAGAAQATELDDLSLASLSESLLAISLPKEAWTGKEERDSKESKRGKAGS